MSALDRRQTERSRAARSSMSVTAGLGLLTALLLVAQAWLIASVVAAAVDSHDPPGALEGALVVLLLVISARAVTAWLIEVSAQRAAATVTSELRRTFLR